jgi:hypothetical protein
MLVNQPTSAPTAKMSAVGGVGAFVTAIVGLLAIFGVTLPDNVSTAAVTLILAIHTLIVFLAGYFKKEKA